MSSVSTLINATTSNSPAPVPSCLAQSDLILNPGFEAGASVWLANPANLITNSTRFSPASGNWYALLGGTGRRANFSLSQGVTLPVNACSASLGFDLMIITTETTKRSRYDTLTVRILDPITNRVLGTSRSYSNLDASSGYGKVKLDLTAYRGKTIRIEFLGQEDQGNSTSFLIDNVSLAIAQ